MQWLDSWLNRVAMYRFVEYVLLVCIFLGAILGFTHVLPYAGWAILMQALVLLAIAWLVNAAFAWAYDVPRHDDSAYITALILAVVIGPTKTGMNIELVVWAPILAMASKYILSLRHQHVVNPAALSMVLCAYILKQPANWWIGTWSMLPVVAIGGFLIVRKIRRWDVVGTFFGVVVGLTLIMSWAMGQHAGNNLRELVLATALVFFGTVMLTEPWTMPPGRWRRMAFGGVVGLLFVPQVHVGHLYFSPELALVIGNVIFAAMSLRGRYAFDVQRVVQLSSTISEIILTAPMMPVYRPGQYMEWHVAHATPDSRGQRRYFTLASSPTEHEVRLGIKSGATMSSYKKTMIDLQPKQKIIGGQLDGDFTLPVDPAEKLVFIAGGIGVTPFRSMVKFLIDIKQRRDIILLYATAKYEDVVYRDVFDQAAEVGVRVKYIVEDATTVPANWSGLTGRITAEVIHREVPDGNQRTFFISGPQGMVDAFRKTLRRLGVSSKHIRSDYFPGFA